MRYYIIAGERSGDLHGGNLIRSIKKLDPQGIFRVWGGDYMMEAGAELVVHYRKMAFMGFLEVLLNARTIAGYLSYCKKDIKAFRPDVIILIDYGGFNFRIASFARKNSYRVFYYISPKIWAWNTKRVYKVKAWVERMFVIFPFEVDFYNKHGVNAEYVGNPVVEAVNKHIADKTLTSEWKSLGYKRIGAFLPGSRKQEIVQGLPVMMQLASCFPDTLFLVAAVNNVNGDLYNICSGHPNVHLIFEKAYDILSVADAAVVTSGTATLETALWKVPQVVIYKANIWISYLIARLVIKVPFISLVNLIAGKEVVRELIQDHLNEKNLLDEFSSILLDENKRSAIFKEYELISRVLGNEICSESAARKMMYYLTGDFRQL